jgi:hypothetical protein
MDFLTQDKMRIVPQNGNQIVIVQHDNRSCIDIEVGLQCIGAYYSYTTCHKILNKIMAAKQAGEKTFIMPVNDKEVD